MRAKSIKTPGKITKGEEASNMEILNFTLEIRPTTNTTRDSLEGIRAVSAFAALLAFLLRMLLLNTKVIGECPIQVASGFDVSFKIEGQRPATSKIATATTSLYEKAFGFLQEMCLAADILKVGNDFAKLIALGELTALPKINPAKSNQKETAVLDSDGTIWLTVKNPKLLIKRFKKLLHLAGFVNSGGYVIAIKLGKKYFNLTPLPVDATKADWIVTETLRLSTLVSGYHPEHKMVEIFLDNEFLVQSVPADNSELYFEAMRDKKAMEILTEVSRPSNPFLSDPAKMRIAETIKIVDPPGQDEIDLAQPK